MTPLKFKFRNTPTELRGRRYDSKAEARYAAALHARKAAGEVIGWLEQTTLHLPGGIRYVLDFLVFEADGNVRAIEVKGMETQAYKLKAKLVAEAYPWLPIEVVRAAPKGRRKKKCD